MTKYNKIIFLFPSRQVGGAQTLFYTMMQEMARRGYQVGLIDYKDGWIKKELDKQIIKFDFFEYENKRIAIGSDAVVVTPSNFMRSLDIYLAESKANVFFWNIHPYNQIPLLPLLRNKLLKSEWFLDLISKTLLRGAFKFSRRLLEETEKNKALCYMDEENYIVTKKLSSSIVERFVPIPISLDQTDLRYVENIGFEKRYGWIGRLDKNFKIYSLERVLRDLDVVANKNDEFAIIGDGPGKAYIENICTELNNLTVVFLGTLTFNEINEEVPAWSIGFAMGTSALQIAKYNVPTVLLGYAHQKISSSYRYKWLYETERYNLGENIDLLKKYAGHQMSDIAEAERKVIGQKCYSYLLENHSIENVAEKFESYLNDSSLEVDSILRIIYTNNSLLTKAFYRVKVINKLRKYV